MSPTPIRIGQFSESPVLAVARALGLPAEYGIDWVTERVPSSPGQFEWLRDGQIDIAITSPDNVLLYASTDKNPLQQQLDVHFLRPIDRGLQLALYTDSSIASVEDFSGATLGVDVMSSGFALLLLSMLDTLGVDSTSITFENVGATPKRLLAINDGSIQGTILNAETAVAAEDQGLTRWATSVDVSDNYLGTVLAQLGDEVSETTAAFVQMWTEATRTILDTPPEDTTELLAAWAPPLATPAYVTILKSTDFGILDEESVSEDQLRVLADIRAKAGAFSPSADDIRRLTAR